MKFCTLYQTHIQVKIEQSICITNSSVLLLPLIFSSTGALYSSLKKRPWEMTRNSNCRAREFQANRTHWYMVASRVKAETHDAICGIQPFFDTCPFRKENFFDFWYSLSFKNTGTKEYGMSTSNVHFITL